jgi:hypothetical protein
MNANACMQQTGKQTKIIEWSEIALQVVMWHGLKEHLLKTRI